MLRKWNLSACVSEAENLKKIRIILKKRIPQCSHGFINSPSSSVFHLQRKEIHSRVSLSWQNRISVRSHPLLYMKSTSVRAGGRGLCRPQLSRRWRCCCVGRPAHETLRGRQEWDFLLQLDTETAVNQSHWPRVDCPLCEVRGPDRTRFITPATGWMNTVYRLKKNISFIFNNWILYIHVKKKRQQ